LISVTYVVSLPVFEGPFDLLYHLVRSQEIDIWSVSVADVTNQYLEYLRLMEEFNLEIASEFLVMAATLLRLKSRMLLPPRENQAEEDEADEELFSIYSSEELIRRILEYRSFKEPAAFLEKREKEQQRIFFRSTGGPRVMHVTRQERFFEQEGLVDKLVEAMQEQMQKKNRREKARDIKLVEEYRLRDRIKVVLGKLSGKKNAVYMDSLLETRHKGEIVTTFIAVLELARQRKISFWQQRNFSPILIQLKDSVVEEEEPNAGD